MAMAELDELTATLLQTKKGKGVLKKVINCDI